MCCDNDTTKKKRIFDKFLLFFLIHIMCIYVYIYIYTYIYIYIYVKKQDIHLDARNVNSQLTCVELSKV